MTVQSKPGQVPLNHTSSFAVPMYIPEGYKLGKWQAPWPICMPKEALFRRFGLWESHAGICMDGYYHSFISGGRWDFITTDPVLSGDFMVIEGVQLQVLEAESTYLDNAEQWRVHVAYDPPKLPEKYEKEENDYNSMMLANIYELHLTQTGLLDDFFTKVLPLCLAGPYPITTAPAAAIWQTIKTDADQKIKNLIDEIEAKQWL